MTQEEEDYGISNIDTWSSLNDIFGYRWNICDDYESYWDYHGYCVILCSYEKLLYIKIESLWDTYGTSRTKIKVSDLYSFREDFNGNIIKWETLDNKLKCENDLVFENLSQFNEFIKYNKNRFDKAIRG